MTETIDDTETITMALTTPCPTVTASVTLVSKTDLTVVVDVQMSPGSGAAWKNYFPFIDWGDNIQDNPVSNGHNTHTYATAGTYTIGVYGANACGKSNNSSLTVTVVAPKPIAAPAKGDITGVDYPASIPKGKVKFNVTADYKNVGGSSGTFYLRLGLWTGTMWFDYFHHPSFTLAAGATGTQAFTTLQSPEIGSPLTELKFRVRMIQIT